MASNSSQTHRPLLILFPLKVKKARSTAVKVVRLSAGRPAVSIDVGSLPRLKYSPREHKSSTWPGWGPQGTVLPRGRPKGLGQRPSTGLAAVITKHGPAVTRRNRHCQRGTLQITPRDREGLVSAERS